MFWRAVLAGLAVGCLPAVALLIALPISGRSSAPEADRVGSGGAAMLRAPPASHVPTVASRGSLRSLRYARRMAGRQLRDDERDLRNCVSRTPATILDWRHCVRWPLAHLAIDGRVSGGVLYAIAERLPRGGCREQALGEANELRILGGLSDEVLHGLSNSSDEAAAETARSFDAATSMMVDVRRQLFEAVRDCADVTVRPQAAR
jgi:hypothetical protein